MSSENIHSDPVFKILKTEFFSRYMLKHLAQARQWKTNGLLVEPGAEAWRNVGKHQLLFSVMAETVGELCNLHPEEIKKISNDGLIHDADKRKQQESSSPNDIVNSEINRKVRPLSATGTNFSDFSDWGIEEYILRYCDSSIGEDRPTGHWFGARDPKNLPAVIIVPWRERINGFKKFKKDEGELGKNIYGMTTWEKLEEIMTNIEILLYERVISQNPDLKEIYPNQTHLTRLIEDKIHEKIMAQL